MDNSKYFYLGGFLSLTFFAFFAALFVYLLFHTLEQKNYGLKKKNYISVSLVVTQKTPSKKVHTKKIKTTSQPVVSAPKKNVDLDVNNLFSDVWTKKIEHKAQKKRVNSKRLSQLQKKIAKTKVNKITPLAEKIDEEQQKQKSQEVSSSANEVNEYLAKIQALVYKYFHVPPNTQGQSVTTVIELDPFGKVLDFRVLQYSQSDALNEEVDKMKERLLHVVFPVNPKHTNSTTKVVLISKE